MLTPLLTPGRRVEPLIHIGPLRAGTLEGRRTAVRQPEASRPRLNLQGTAILIVEDEPDSLELLSQIVASFGATVMVARDGREGIEAVLGRPPDLVLCDLRMPAFDGFQFMDWFRGRPPLSRIPVIAVTALDSHADVVRTCSAGFNAHLVKPITYASIQAALERFFRPHGKPQPQ